MAADAESAVFEPVAPPTTFEETVERLGTAIRLGLLDPGTRLPSERELAEQLGISRSTLRQAITTLVQSGLLLSVRGRGGGTFVVQEPPLAEGPPQPLRPDWRDVLALREAIEVGAVTLAADRADAATVALLRDCVRRMAEATEFDEYRRADIRLHIGIAEGTGVARIVALATEVQAEMSELIAHIAHPPAVLEHSNREHVRIVDAIEAHDAAGAARIVRRHLDGTEHILGGLRRAGG
jgi:GntR family transcriptional regulator, transcriptional repressor for pyruvate dehydrogenase complex